MKINLFKCIIPAILMVCAFYVAKAQEKGHSKERSLEIVNEIVSRPDVVGASLAVGIENEVVFAQGFGFADKDSESKVNTENKFRIYSLSKHITAVAAARAREMGLLNLDSPIGSIIPFLSPQYQEITSRQLIGHLSGVKGYNEGDWQEFANMSCATPFEAIRFFEDDSLDFPPGTDYSYTSFGYVLLSAVIEKSSGMPFLDFINKELMTPNHLQMLSIDDCDNPDPMAVKPYEYWKEVMYDARYANNSCKFGGGGMLASPAEVVKFDLALLNGKILSEESLEELFTPMLLKNGNSTGYGFGIEKGTDEEGKTYWWHTGRSRGGRNALVIYPEKKLVVCLSLNTNGENILNEALEISNAFLE